MDEAPCNLPFERVPTCACDPGYGPALTKQQRLECRLRRGPCAARQAGPETIIDPSDVTYR